MPRLLQSREMIVVRCGRTANYVGFRASGSPSCVVLGESSVGDVGEAIGSTVSTVGCKVTARSWRVSRRALSSTLAMRSKFASSSDLGCSG